MIILMIMMILWPCLAWHKIPSFVPIQLIFMSHYVQLVMITTSTEKKESMLIVVVAVLLVLLRLNLDDSSAMIMMTVNSIVDHICTFHLFSASSNQLILFFSRQNGQSTHAYTYLRLLIFRCKNDTAYITHSAGMKLIIINIILWIKLFSVHIMVSIKMLLHFLLEKILATCYNT